MKLNAYSKRDDGIADLARAAGALADGNGKKFWWFLEAAERKLGKIAVNKDLIDVDNNKYWAEKILDEYYYQKYSAK